MGIRTLEQVKAELTAEPPLPCDFKVGDRVVFTNEAGCVFSGLTVIGFADEVRLNGRFIHLDTDAYWFPHRPEELRHEIQKDANAQNAVDWAADEAERTRKLKDQHLKELGRQWHSGALWGICVAKTHDAASVATEILESGDLEEFVKACQWSDSDQDREALRWVCTLAGKECPNLEVL